MPASAQDSGWYVGAGIHHSRYDMDPGELDALAVAAGFSSASTTITDDRDVSWKILAGYRFHPNLAVELSHIDLRKNLGLRGEYERFTNVGKSETVGEADVDLWSLNLLFRF